MSYEYYGYDFEPIPQHKSHVSRRLYDIGGSGWLDDSMSYEKLIEIRNRWQRKLGNKDWDHMTACILHITQIVECDLKFDDIWFMGEYFHIPSLSITMRLPIYVGIDAMLELYKL